MAQNHYSDDIQLARNNGSGPGQHQSIPWGSPPPYKIDREDTLAPYWWDMREWSWKKFMLLGVGIAIVIIILVVAIVEVEKENAYPDYSPLNYTLLDTCQYFLFSKSILQFSLIVLPRRLWNGLF